MFVTATTDPHFCHKLKMPRISMSANWNLFSKNTNFPGKKTKKPNQNKNQTKQADVTKKKLRFLDVSPVPDFFLALPGAGLGYVHTGSEAQVNYHNNSFQFGKKIEEIGEPGYSPVETHLFHCVPAPSLSSYHAKLELWLHSPWKLSFSFMEQRKAIRG